jgi:hypothetical protein
VILLIVLVVLILMFGAGGVYTGRPGYAGPNVGGLLWVLMAVCVALIVFQLIAGSLP